MLVAVYLLGVVGTRIALNYRENYTGGLSAVDETLTNDKPTLLMLYSNY